MQFQAVRCPNCDAVVTEIAFGMSRTRCPGRRCHSRLTVASDGERVQVVQVDTPRKRLQDKRVTAYAPSPVY